MSHLSSQTSDLYSVRINPRSFFWYVFQISDRVKLPPFFHTVGYNPFPSVFLLLSQTHKSKMFVCNQKKADLYSLTNTSNNSVEEVSRIVYIS